VKPAPVSLKTPMSAGELGLGSIFFMTRKRRLRNPVAHADVLCVIRTGGKRRDNLTERKWPGLNIINASPRSPIWWGLS